MIRRIRYSLFLAIVLTLPSGVAFANGQHDLQRLLRGTYRFHSTEVCLESGPGGFSTDPPFLPSEPSAKYHTSVMGLANFDGNGNAVFTVKTMTVNDGPYPHPFAPQPVGYGNLTCNKTYTVDSDRTFRMEGSCTSIFPAPPPPPGQPPLSELQFQIDGIVSEGFIGPFRDTLIEAAIAPIEQTVSLGPLPNSGYPPFWKNQRKCTFTSTYLRDRRNRSDARMNGQQSEKDDKLNPLPWW